VFLTVCRKPGIRNPVTPVITNDVALYQLSYWRRTKPGRLSGNEA